MTVIETPTRAEVVEQRAQLVQHLHARYGTAERAALRELSVSGDMSSDDATCVDRLLDFDFLLGAK
jgi:hypothetical protein